MRHSAKKNSSTTKQEYKQLKSDLQQINALSKLAHMQEAEVCGGSHLYTHPLFYKRLVVYSLPQIPFLAVLILFSLSILPVVCASQVVSALLEWEGRFQARWQRLVQGEFAVVLAKGKRTIQKEVEIFKVRDGLKFRHIEYGMGEAGTLSCKIVLVVFDNLAVSSSVLCLP